MILELDDERGPLLLACLSVCGRHALPEQQVAIQELYNEVFIQLIRQRRLEWVEKENAS